MKTYKLKDFYKGWMIGDFSPSVYRTKSFEICIREYKKNDFDKPHYHKLLDEYTIIIKGKVKINGQIFKKNDIVLLEKNEVCVQEILSNTATMVFIKIPSIPTDKHCV